MKFRALTPEASTIDGETSFAPFFKQKRVLLPLCLILLGFGFGLWTGLKHADVTQMLTDSALAFMERKLPWIYPGQDDLELEDEAYTKELEVINADTTQNQPQVEVPAGEFTWSAMPDRKNEREEDRGIYFAGVKRPFGKIDLSKSYLLGPSEWNEVVLESVPVYAKFNLKNFLPDILKYSEHYQVDPFWVMAVMWTESSFNPRAKSRFDAYGLMQIMPDTGKHIAKVMGRKLSKRYMQRFRKHPEYNIELGTFYLKKLLKRYHHNYMLATCAYNLGPGNVRKMKREGVIIGKQNLYLDKVLDNYKKLTRVYQTKVSGLDHPYLFTYIVRNRKSAMKLESAKKEWQILKGLEQYFSLEPDFRRGQVALGEAHLFPSRPVLL